MNTWIVIGFVCVCVLLETVAEIVLNKWAKPKFGGGNSLMVIGIACYVGIAVAYAHGLSHGSVTVANAWWQCLSLIVITVVGITMFRNRPTIGQWCGISIVAFGTVLLLAGSPELKGASTSAWFKEWSPIK
jgi:multidrug transporter EmrE-like cation transporter